MQYNQQSVAAAGFARKWEGRGYEKGESQPFWMELIQTVLSVERPYDIISFENQVKLSSTSFIDAYIEPTHTLIEQKSIDKDLRKAIPQSDGSLLKPFGQARLTVSCRKLLKSDMKESDFIDKEVLDKWYGNAGYHSVYVLEIEKLWK